MILEDRREVEGDITDVAAVRAALRRHQVFAVMHFAAFLDVGESVREPARYYRNNVAGALSVLEAMVAESVNFFVFSSTCATYGEPLETPIPETHAAAAGRGALDRRPRGWSARSRRSAGTRGSRA